MSSEIDKNLETAGKEAYDRLKKAWAVGSPYGSELADSIVNALMNKMMLPVDKRINWLIDELKLNIAKKGMFNFEGQPRGLAVRLLSQTSLYGAEDYVPLLRAILKMKSDDVAVPQNLSSDIDLTRNWMNSKYGTNL